RFVRRRSRHVYGPRRSTEDVFGTHGPGNSRAVTVLSDRQTDFNPRGDVAFPPAPHKRVALGLQKTVAGIRCATANIERRRTFISSVDDIVQGRVIPAASVYGFEDRKIGRVLDHSAQISRR